jgi:tryptophanyl-tRNA synthetase
MNNDYINKSKKEYQEKLKLGKSIDAYYDKKLEELNLNSFKRIGSYLDEFLPEKNIHMSRNIIFAHLGFEPFTTQIAEGKPFTVVSGLNPSSPLHLGHKVLFDLLLSLQKMGADIFIPITNDESYIDGKVKSLAESRKIAYEEIIPSIIAFGFDPAKTKIFVCSDYPDIYNLAMMISKHVTNKYVSTVFGNESLDNSGKAFYRSAVQLAQILLPQLDEFGGIKNTLIPVGIDQHPYILIARDISKKLGFVPPSELIFKFQNSLINPFEKMSGSKPKTAIYLNDTPEDIEEKIHKAHTGAVSLLQVHKELGGIPEACSVFSLLKFHCTDEKFVSDIYKQYKNGDLMMKDLKKITTDFIVKLVIEHQDKKKKIDNVDSFLLKKPLKSIL